MLFLTSAIQKALAFRLERKGFFLHLISHNPRHGFPESG